MAAVDELHYRGHCETHGDQYQNAERTGPPSDARVPENGGQVRGVQPFSQTTHALLQRRQSKKDKRKSGECRAGGRRAAAAQELDQRPNEDHRQRSSCERNSDPDEGNEPAGPRGANICPEYEAEPLWEGE
jgi:hypothetical protein